MSPLVYYQNVRGLRTKLVELRCALALTEGLYDVIILTETWLNNSVNNSELGLQDYVIYRYDRNEKTSKHRRGRGVLIAVRDCLPTRIVDLSSLCVEHLAVQVTFGTKSVVFIAVYIPPNTDINIYDSYCRSLTDVWCSYKRAELVIAGDYNLPRVSWKNGRCMRVDGECGDEVLGRVSLLCDCFNKLGLHQFNTVPNASNYALDLIFSTLRGINVTASLDPLLTNDGHHPTLRFGLPLNNVGRPTRMDKTVRCFERADFGYINDYLNNIEWNSELLEQGVDGAVDRLYYHLNYIVGICVPSRRVRTSSYPVWYSKELIDLLKVKKGAHREFKKSHRREDYQMFSHLRSECKRLSAVCWSSYMGNMERVISTNPRSFWGFVRSMRIPGSRFLHIKNGSEYLENENSIANHFTDYFGSTYLHGDQDVTPQYTELETTTGISSMNISISEIYNGIEVLSPNCGVGPDELPSILFKKCIFVMSRILKIVYNESLRNGIFPTAWKQCIVTPTFKGGDESLAANYRSISKQSVIAKIFDGIVERRMRSQCRSIIASEQHGFMPGRSTATNLLI